MGGNWYGMSGQRTSAHYTHVPLAYRCECAFRVCFWMVRVWQSNKIIYLARDNHIYSAAFNATFEAKHTRHT